MFKKITLFLLIMGVALSPFTLRQSNIVKAAEPLPTGFVAGDVDGSKKVDLSDIVSLAQHVAGWQVEYSEKTLDPNGDYICNLDDVVYLAQYIAGWDVELSKEEFDANLGIEGQEKLYVYNEQAPLTTQYRGVSSSVYHAYGHMLDDKTGRVYTDAQLTTELDRLQDAGVRYARTRYYSGWIWDDKVGGYNWDKNRAQYFYNYCKNLGERDINVVLQVGWHLGCFTHIESGSIDEVPYITKSENYPDDIYGETADFNFGTCRNAEYRRMAKEVLRFAHFYAETLRQTRARGIYNISHFLYWTEPSYATRLGGTLNSTSHPAYGNEGSSPSEYIFLVQTFQQKLKDEGVYSFVKHVGPNQGSIKHGNGLIKYILDRGHKDMFDVWTAHFYPTASKSTDNVYYDICDTVFKSYLNTFNSAGLAGKKEFWVDEFYCRSDEAKLGIDNAWNGLQTVVGAICAQQLGINNISQWQIFDQLWTDQKNTGGEFQNGIHAVGAAPSLFISDIPRRQYYFVGLFTKYNGYKNGESYLTNNSVLQNRGSDIHVGAAKMENGSWTITVINAGISKKSVTIEFDKAINQTLYRHSENVDDVAPSNKAKLAGIDKTFKNVKTSFSDWVAPGSVTVYTGVNY